MDRARPARGTRRRPCAALRRVAFSLQGAGARTRALRTNTPDAEQARRGFAAENQSGLALDDPQRCYRDPNGKPELICALDRFEALCGFRDPEASRSDIAALGGEAAAQLLSAFDSEGYAGALRLLLSLPSSVRAQITEAACRLERPAASLVQRLQADFPNDAGVNMPLLLEHVVLGPGEALFLEAGKIHAYLGGLALEVMGNSDNVLRGGLHRNTSRSTNSWPPLDYTSEATPVLRDDASGELQFEYLTSAEEFTFRRVAVPANEDLELHRDALSAPPKSGFCTKGSLAVTGPGGGALRLARGQSLFVPAAARKLRVSATAEATVFIAGAEA